MDEFTRDTELKKNVRRILKRDRDILFAYLFGSQATGLTHGFSDIDVACYLKPGNMKYYLKKDNQLLGDLAIGLHTSEFDFVLLNVAPLVLKFEVVSRGEVIFSRDEQLRVDFETATLYRYFDLKPYLDEYDAILREKMKAAAR